MKKESIDKEELVSIVMPVYNCEKYLKDTISSVKSQTYLNWELIIVDDCSCDMSLNIINKEIEDIKDKVKLVCLKKNLGEAKARNRAIKETKGRYIAFLDSDDIWDKEKLKKQINFMKENNYYFTYTYFSYLKEDRIRKILKIPDKLDYKKALKNTCILLSTVIIDTNVIDKDIIVMPNVKQGADTATWWSILKRGYVAYCLPEYLTNYRVRKDSVSYNKIIASKRTWKLYRNIENMNVLKSLYYFSFYAFNAIRKRSNICNK